MDPTTEVEMKNRFVFTGPVRVVCVWHFEMVDHELDDVRVHHIIVKRRAFFPNIWCQIERDRIDSPRSTVSVGGVCCKVISQFCCCRKTRFSSAFLRGYTQKNTSPVVGS
jgi:hypothetical protein